MPGGCKPEWNLCTHRVEMAFPSETLVFPLQFCQALNDSPKQFAKNPFESYFIFLLRKEVLFYLLIEKEAQEHLKVYCQSF